MSDVPAWKTLLTDPAAGLVREVRQPQVNLAEAVAAVDADGGFLVAEAPTGIGKSFAYLLPALEPRGDKPPRRVVVSAPTKALQAQLYFKDVPAVLKAHKSTLSAALVKGAGNYACGLRAEAHAPSDSYWSWLRTSRHGDYADYPSAAPRWFPLAAADHCVGAACPRADSCGFIRMRNDAAAAGVVVTNHHLVALDLLAGGGALLGGEYDMLIVDEAHQLADALRGTYTVEISAMDGGKMLETARQVACSGAEGAIEAATQYWPTLFDSLSNRHWRECHERKWPVFEDFTARQTDTHLRAARRFLDRALEAETVPSPDLPKVKRLRRDVDAASRALKMLQGWLPEPAEDGESDADAAEVAEALKRAEQRRTNTVLYGERRGQAFVVGAAPVDLGGIAHAALSQIRAVVLTSATLTTSGSLDPFCASLGVPSSARKMILPTTFDLARQGVLYIPANFPYAARPRQGDAESARAYAEYMQRIIDECTRLVTASGGSAFILCTANDELMQIATALRQTCPDITVVQQSVRVEGTGLVGDGEPAQVLAKYLAAPRAVLLGSKSFWEGVDVPGAALELVIITKLPFPPQRDPVTMARRRASGHEANAFRLIDLMDMQVDLRQGAGRLIRTKRDVGLLAILDDRLYTRNYGAETRAALFPPNACTRLRTHALAYLTKLQETRARRRTPPGT